jgi:hypothetical protein
LELEHGNQVSTVTQKTLMIKLPDSILNGHYHEKKAQTYPFGGGFTAIVK